MYFRAPRVANLLRSISQYKTASPYKPFSTATESESTLRVSQPQDPIEKAEGLTFDQDQDKVTPWRKPLSNHENMKKKQRSYRENSIALVFAVTYVLYMDERLDAIFDWGQLVN